MSVWTNLSIYLVRFYIYYHATYHTIATEKVISFNKECNFISTSIRQQKLMKYKLQKK